MMSRRQSRRMQVVSMLVVVGLAFWLGTRVVRHEASPVVETVVVTDEGVWTCSMHPQIRLPEPGLCPICSMELVPVMAVGDETLGPREYRLSERAQKLAEVETSLVERRYVSAEIRLAGRVSADETRVAVISAWVPGRLEKLHVAFTGVSVKKGEPMVELYSPELLSAQQELISARRAWRQAPSASLKQSARQIYEASREKLILWGLTEAQVNEIIRSGTPGERMTIVAPMSGVVTRRHADEGNYVTTGSPIYHLADLRQVWLELDAYETDLAWIAAGQRVRFSTTACGESVFMGTVSFVDPFLDERTRTVGVRVEVANEDGRLKPGMLVFATLEAGEESCALFVARTTGQRTRPLVIPSSAPLFTGRRAVVYVADIERPGIYEGRTIELGPRAGEWYIVNTGLAEGERVVTRGNFKIDSALQIQGRASMMSPGGGPAPVHHHHGAAPPEMLPTPEIMPPPKAAAPPAEEEPMLAAAPPQKKHETPGVPAAFREQMGGVVMAYLVMHEALAADRLEEARRAAAEVQRALEEVDMKILGHDEHMAWMKDLGALSGAVKTMAAGRSLNEVREGFGAFIRALIQTLDRFGFAGPVLYRLHCPMAFQGRGSDWLQTDEAVRNPYFGSAMPRCGEVTGRLEPGER